MLAGLQRGCRLRMAHLGRRAQRNRIDITSIGEQLIERREMRNAVERSIAARDRGEFDAVGG